MTTKKKTKQTPKDDLIESLMNDVQELSDQETLHGNASSDLFSNSEYSESGDPVEKDKDFAAHLVSEVGDEEDLEGLDHSHDHEGAHENDDMGGAADLWQALQNNQATGREDSEVIVIDEEPLPHESAAPPAFPGIDAAEEVSAFPSAQSSPPKQAQAAANPIDDKTMNLSEAQLAGVPLPPTPVSSSTQTQPQQDNDKTVAVAGFANRQPLSSQEVTPKVSLGAIRSASGATGSVYAASDATLAQSENLRMAQRRILELEKEVEKYRYENDELASAGEIIRERAENMAVRISKLESEKQEAVESLQTEMMILKGTHQYKETELAKARLKIEELEGRLKSDFKKIRVRERELENRLELVKAEKSALLRAKDENILDLKRKIDHLQSELDNYRVKVLELNKTIDVNQEQFKRTVRALRLALSNLEVKEESVVPLKKAD